MFLINSRSHLVSAASLSSCRKTFTYKGRTFSRSYGTILPSSFTRVLSSALVFSTCPPVSVCGTVLISLASSFSWKPGINDFAQHRSVKTTSHLRVNEKPDLPRSLPTCTNQDNQRLAHLAFSVPTSPLIKVQEY